MYCNKIFTSYAQIISLTFYIYYYYYLNFDNQYYVYNNSLIVISTFYVRIIFILIEFDRNMYFNTNNLYQMEFTITYIIKLYKYIIYASL